MSLGLPHAHNLIWLNSRIPPNKIDELISAELPSPFEDPELFEIIKTHMIHGQCGSYNNSAPCMGTELKFTKRYINA